VLDRFHIARKLGEAIDEMRRQEGAQLTADGDEPVLKNSRDCFLKKWRTHGMLSLLDSSGRVECLSLRINLCMKKAWGYLSFEMQQTSLNHTIGDLTELNSTTDFAEKPTNKIIYLGSGKIGGATGGGINWVSEEVSMNDHR